ncbi:MAG: hypothetical protein PHE43_00295 [Candidatus Nanoarchaeia archaeon]|nr:hypothetical protein [Candidatus Nanoarchaeia archaeon]
MTKVVARGDVYLEIYKHSPEEEIWGNLTNVILSTPPFKDFPQGRGKILFKILFDDSYDYDAFIKQFQGSKLMSNNLGAYIEGNYYRGFLDVENIFFYDNPQKDLVSRVNFPSPNKYPPKPYLNLKK